ncbi:hypothetical protein JOC34_002823 [Virgibacillus halotolerans]|uniref:major capsid protein n=1 Tax=Virgibacillus halotolerans TaxID=1071053 RepID=UPI0019612A4C|nr:major capsid protein [Virgibacillus halotolerans]MBM7600432.1 hypothetical protein [Virgibacillus halotolerans]
MANGITQLEEFQQPVLKGLVDATVENVIPSFADEYLQDEQIFSPNFTYDIFKANPSIAGFVGYGSEPPVMDRDEVAKGVGEVAKMGHKYIMTYEELMALHQAKTNDETRAIVDRLVMKNSKLVENVKKLASVSKLQAIAQGTFSYDRNKVKINVDYKVPEDHKIALTSGNDWAEADHDVIGDLLEWNEKYIESNGKQADLILMTRETQALLLKNAVIVAESGRPENATRVNADELSSVLGAYGLPAIKVITERFNVFVDDHTGETVRQELFPVNRVVFVSKEVGKFYYGPTLENNMKPGIVLLAEDLRQPIRSVVEAHAAGFPVITTPSLLLHADVFTP